MSSHITDTGSILELNNLRIEREDVRIVRGVSWRVHAGEHWAILGPNGSGKTSLLSALTGYLCPTAGNITLLGEEFGRSDWRKLRQRIGIAGPTIAQMIPPEEESLDVVIAGREAVVGYWGIPSESDRAEAMRLLRKVGCGKLADRPWRLLSQGERQRVLIARAMAARPLVLLLDEPCAGLDPVAREHFLEFLDELGRDKSSPTILLVTHHVEEITPAFTHALLLGKGVALGAGPKDEVLRSELLSKAFGDAITLRRRQGRYRLFVESPRKARRYL